MIHEGRKLISNKDLQVLSDIDNYLKRFDDYNYTEFVLLDMPYYRMIVKDSSVSIDELIRILRNHKGSVKGDPSDYSLEYDTLSSTSYEVYVGNLSGQITYTLKSYSRVHLEIVLSGRINRR